MKLIVDHINNDYTNIDRISFIFFCKLGTDLEYNYKT